MVAGKQLYILQALQQDQDQDQGNFMLSDIEDQPASSPQPSAQRPPQPEALAKHPVPIGQLHFAGQLANTGQQAPGADADGDREFAFGPVRAKEHCSSPADGLLEGKWHLSKPGSHPA